VIASHPIEICSAKTMSSSRRGFAPRALFGSPVHSGASVQQKHSIRPDSRFVRLAPFVRLTPFHSSSPFARTAPFLANATCGSFP